MTIEHSRANYDLSLLQTIEMMCYRSVLKGGALKVKGEIEVNGKKYIVEEVDNDVVVKFSEQQPAELSKKIKDHCQFVLDNYAVKLNMMGLEREYPDEICGIVEAASSITFSDSTKDAAFASLIASIRIRGINSVVEECFLYGVSCKLYLEPSLESGFKLKIRPSDEGDALSTEQKQKLTELEAHINQSENMALIYQNQKDYFQPQVFSGLDSKVDRPAADWFELHQRDLGWGEMLSLIMPAKSRRAVVKDSKYYGKYLGVEATRVKITNKEIALFSGQVKQLLTKCAGGTQEVVYPDIFALMTQDKYKSENTEQYRAAYLLVCKLNDAFNGELKESKLKETKLSEIKSVVQAAYASTIPVCSHIFKIPDVMDGCIQDSIAMVSGTACFRVKSKRDLVEDLTNLFVTADDYEQTENPYTNKKLQISDFAMLLATPS